MKNYKQYISKEDKIAQNLYILIGNNREAIIPEEIIFIEADINYSTFYMQHRRFTTSFHLGFFEQSLQDKPHFVRISKSFIVNTQFLKNISWQGSHKTIELYDGTRLTISRRKAKKVKECLNMLSNQSIINHI